MSDLLRIANFNDLLQLAARDKVPHQIDQENQVLQIPTKSGALEGVLFVRWEKSLPYCNAIQPMIMEVPAERVAAVESAIARINHAVALPGFAYDHERRFIYFRNCIAIEPDGMQPDFLRLMIMAAVNNARDFINALRGVVHGSPPEGVLKAAVEEASTAKAAEVGSTFKD